MFFVVCRHVSLMFVAGYLDVFVGFMNLFFLVSLHVTHLSWCSLCIPLISLVAPNLLDLNHFTRSSGFTGFHFIPPEFMWFDSTWFDFTELYVHFMWLDVTRFQLIKCDLYWSPWFDSNSCDTSSFHFTWFQWWLFGFTVFNSNYCNLIALDLYWFHLILHGFTCSKHNLECCIKHTWKQWTSCRTIWDSVLEVTQKIWIK